MQTHPVRAPLDIRHDDPRLRYRGAVSLQRGPGWTAPWRLPREEAALYLPEGGLGRAAMPSGVRVTLRTDSAWLVCRYQADPAPRLNGPEGADRLHPAAAGHPDLASRFTTLLHRARCVPILMTAAQ
ncbi:hypothetical protein [Streptomyces yatensis]|uniref:SsfX3-like N-terminal domain-containing protein n=1 Tax=Streptomyces yatensis TaxID=155177 RepID=A0ABN2HHF0_9ACTN|nr:hypothetical protein [Streptomyces yatensis]